MTSHKELQRIEAFSDGVFAIASTLLILEIAVPHVDDVMHPGALWLALKAEWPSLVAYLLGFESILVAWAGHQRGLTLLTKSSKAFLYANGFLLLSITFMPFPTAVLARYIDTPQANIAVMLYSAAWFVTNLAFNLWWLTMFRPVRLLSSSLSKAAARKVTRHTISGTVLYACTIVLSYWFPIAGFLIIFASQMLWIVVSIGDDEAQ